MVPLGQLPDGRECRAVSRIAQRMDHDEPVNLPTQTEGIIRRAVGTTEALEKTAAFSAAVQPGLDVQADATELPKPSDIEELHNGAGVRATIQSRILGDTGFEPVTSCVSCMRSNQLS